MPFSVYFDWKEMWPASGSVISHWLYVKDLKSATLNVGVKVWGRALH